MLTSIQGLLSEGLRHVFHGAEVGEALRGHPLPSRAQRKSCLNFIRADRHLLPLHRALTSAGGFASTLSKLVHCLSALSLQV